MIRLVYRACVQRRRVFKLPVSGESSYTVRYKKPRGCTQIRYTDDLKWRLRGKPIGGQRNPIKLSWWPLLFGVLAAQHGVAQPLETVAPSAAPCLRAHCGSLAEPQPRPTVAINKAEPAARSLPSSGARDWTYHIGAREQGEQYNCLLSVGFGGELRSNGYKGIRLLGQTRTLNLSGGRDSQ